MLSSLDVFMVIKSSSDGELLSTSEMEASEKYNTLSAADGARLLRSGTNHTGLKRTFTLPRNPIRFSKRNKPRDERQFDAQSVRKKCDDENDDDIISKKLFRRYSLRKFVNKLAEHISHGRKYDDPRVPINGECGLVVPHAHQQWDADQIPGVTGLRNHGNTCFMNAVLQCLAHTDVLAEYFVLDRYKVDLSHRNKLNSRKFGTRGELTEQLALMLKALWACKYSAELSSAFKATVERFGTQYRGTQQHDAQEFLLWLLDKVHEDLNTASKRKYKAIKTHNRPDEVIAHETLLNHTRCNSSFVQKLFQAQFRSSLACPSCLYKSNTFDPFHCISVQLPQLARHAVFVNVLYTSQQPRQVRIGVSVSQSATIAELREQLSLDTSISVSDMILTEIHSGAEDGDAGFGRVFADTHLVSNTITPIDPIYCIETPTLKDLNEETTTSAYILLCWMNVVVTDGKFEKFGSPYTMQVSRETSYADLQKLVLKEMAPMLHDDVLTTAQACDLFVMRLYVPALGEAQALDATIPHPLFTEVVDQALVLCSVDAGPLHIKLVLEWDQKAKESVVADDSDKYEEHSSVQQLKEDQTTDHAAPLTLDDCLRHYTRAETLAPEDAWRCPHCQKYLPVVKTLGLWSLPEILVVHLKRFRQQQFKGKSSSKLTTMVDFPMHGFDMSPHLAEKSNPLISTSSNPNHIQTSAINQQKYRVNTNQSYILNGWSPFRRSTRTRKDPIDTYTSDNNIYDLYGVIYHHGNDLETGHYTATCRNPYDTLWYNYDDTKVTNLSGKSTDITADLVNNSAYILFYQKRHYDSHSNTSTITSSSSASARMSVSVTSTNSAATSASANSSTSGKVCDLSGNTVKFDHWVYRMPKFNYSPSKDGKEMKDAKTSEKPTETNNKNEKVQIKTEPNRKSDSIPEKIESTQPIDVVESKPNVTPLYTTSIYINEQGEVDIAATITPEPQAIQVDVNDQIDDSSDLTDAHTAAI